MSHLSAIWPDDVWGWIIRGGAVVAASYVIITKALVPFGRGLQDGWRAMRINADRITQQVPDHAYQIADLADRMDRHEVKLDEGLAKIDKVAADVATVKVQQRLDHDWTHAALTGVAKWSEQFQEFEPVQLPEREDMPHD